MKFLKSDANRTFASASRYLTRWAMLERTQSHVLPASAVDPFAPKEPSLFSAMLATALFRCWHILIFYGLWSTAIALISHNVYDLSIQPTLLTVFGTVLGFVISYRTTSSFERYNEGRRLWSQIILASRTFARTTWLHVADVIPVPEDMPKEEQKARSTIEKKTIINLLEGFSVAVKHYLRGEDGIYYKDLYHLVKFLPAYALPAGMPPVNHGQEATDDTISALPLRRAVSKSQKTSEKSSEDSSKPSENGTLPQPATSPGHRRMPSAGRNRMEGGFLIPRHEEEKELLPASLPPRYHVLDIFPFSLLVRILTKRGKEMKGRKAARLRARLMTRTISHNLPLEISFYLSSYVSALQNRKSADVPTINTLLLSLNQLVDALTGLERILTTPIPFSYSFHLWVVTVLYCLALPFQTWGPLGWISIPGTVLVSFVFFGFLVAGEEIENPFGYDKNDLNLDHFTQNIIRNELRALTSAAPPDPADWAFSPENNVLFPSDKDERITPNDWVNRGYDKMHAAMVVTA